MKQNEIVAALSEINRKLADGSAISEADVSTMFKVAKATNRPDHRVLYAQVQRVFRYGHDEIPEVPAETPVTAEDVEQARLKAKRTGKIEDRAEYSLLRQKLEGANQDGI